MIMMYISVIKGISERANLASQGETLKILEMGAGVGAITQVLAPFLATLNIPVEFTVTDPSSSLVASARRRFGEQYPFMRCPRGCAGRGSWRLVAFPDRGRRSACTKPSDPTAPS